MALLAKEMIEVDVTEEVRQAARNRVEDFYTVNRRSPDIHQYGHDAKRMFVGFLGEEIVRDYYNVLDPDSHPDYDLVINNCRVDVKTRACKSKPKLDYMCSANWYVYKTGPDYYLFLRVRNDFNKAWILGYIKCKEFYKKSIIQRRGEPYQFNKHIKSLATSHANVLHIRDIYPVRQTNA